MLTSPTSHLHALCAAFSSFQCKGAEAPAVAKTSELSGSQMQSQAGNSVKASTNAAAEVIGGRGGGKGSSKPAKSNSSRGLSKPGNCRVLLSESPQSPDLPRPRKARLGSLSSETPFKRRLKAPTQSGPPMKVPQATHRSWSASAIKPALSFAHLCTRSCCRGFIGNACCNDHDYICSRD